MQLNPTKLDTTQHNSCNKVNTNVNHTPCSNRTTNQRQQSLSLSLSLSSFPLLSLSKSAAARGWDGQVGCRSVGGKAGATSVKWGKERHWGAGYVVQREETPPVGVVMLAFSFQELQSWGSVCQSFVATQTFEMRGAGPHITGTQSNTAPRCGRHTVFRRPAQKKQHFSGPATVKVCGAHY